MDSYLHYPDPMITFIHGIGGRPGHFSPLLQHLGDLPHRLIPLPGHSPISESSKNLMNDDAVTTVAQAAQRIATSSNQQPATSPDPTLLAGHSTGGVIALYLAAHNLIRVDGLILIDSNVPINPTAVAAKQAKAQLAEHDDWRELMRASLEKDWTGPENFKHRVFHDLDHTPAASLRELWGDVLRTDSAALWHQLSPNLPALYLRSTRDLDISDVAHLPAQVRIQPVGAGHWPHIHSPAVCADEITTWLAHHFSFPFAQFGPKP